MSFVWRDEVYDWLVVEDWERIEEEVVLTVGADWRRFTDARVAFQSGYPERVIETLRERQA